MRTLHAQPASLPRGGTLTPRRFLMLGLLLGSASGFESLHDLLELAMPRSIDGGAAGDAAVFLAARRLPAEFLLAVENAQDQFETNPICAQRDHRLAVTRVPLPSFPFAPFAHSF